MSPSVRAPGARAPLPSSPRVAGAAWSAGVVVAAGLLVMLRGQPEPRHPPLPERTGAPDTSAVPVHVRTSGGAVLLRLSGWAKPAVLADMAAAGLRPLDGYAELERLDSIGMSVVGGRVLPGGLDRIAALPYVLRIEPLP